MINLGTRLLTWIHRLLFGITIIILEKIINLKTSILIKKQKRRFQINNHVSKFIFEVNLETELRNKMKLKTKLKKI